jgi:hypothetical protein
MFGVTSTALHAGIILHADMVLVRTLLMGMVDRECFIAEGERMHRPFLLSLFFIPEFCNFNRTLISN